MQLEFSIPLRTNPFSIQSFTSSCSKSFLFLIQVCFTQAHTHLLSFVFYLPSKTGLPNAPFPNTGPGAPPCPTHLVFSLLCHTLQFRKGC